MRYLPLILALVVGFGSMWIGCWLVNFYAGQWQEVPGMITTFAGVFFGIILGINAISEPYK